MICGRRKIYLLGYSLIIDGDNRGNCCESVFAESVFIVRLQIQDNGKIGGIYNGSPESSGLEIDMQIQTDQMKAT